MIDKLNNISSESVLKATGRDWDEWIAFIRESGGDNMDHRELVHLAGTAGQVESLWWQQSVAVGYEFARGRRVTGQTEDAGFQLGVQRTVPMNQKTLWQLLFSEAGLTIWLGKTKGISLEPGSIFKTSDGTSGEIRRTKPGERIRLRLNGRPINHPITMQITLTCSRNTASRTTLRFHAEKLHSEEERNTLRKHWNNLFDALIHLAKNQI